MASLSTAHANYTCEFSYADLMTYIDAFHVTNITDKFVKENLICDDRFRFNYAVKSCVVLAFYTLMTIVYARKLLIRLVSYNFVLNLNNPPMLLNLLIMTFCFLESMRTSNLDGVHWNDGSIHRTCAEMATAFLIACGNTTVYMTISVISTIVDDYNTAQRPTNHYKNKNKVTPEIAAPDGNVAPKARESLLLRRLRLVFVIQFTSLVIESLLQRQLRYYFYTSRNILQGIDYLVVMTGTATFLFASAIMLKQYYKLLAALDDTAAVQVTRYLRSSILMSKCTIALIAPVVFLQLYRAYSSFTRRDFQLEAATDGISFFDVAKMSCCLIVLFYTKVDESKFSLTSVRKKKHRSKSSASILGAQSADLKGTFKSDTTASIREAKMLKRGSTSIKDGILGLNNKSSKALQLVTSVRQSTLIAIETGPSLIDEGITMMDQEFDVLDEDSITNVSLTLSQKIRMHFFTFIAALLCPAFVLVMILGSSAMPAVVTCMVFFLATSVLLTLVASDRSRKEEIDVIIDSFNGRNAQWFNYIAMFMDVVTLSFASIDVDILFSRHAPEGLVLTMNFLVDIMYNPDAFLTGSLMSMVVIEAISVATIIIVSTISLLNLLSKMIKFRRLFRRWIDVGNTLIYDLLSNSMITILLKGSACYVEKSEAEAKYQFHYLLRTYPHATMFGHPTIKCDGGYLHLIYTMTHWMVLLAALVTIGIFYMVYARNIQARPRIREIPSFVGLRVSMKVAVTFLVTLLSRNVFPSDESYSIVKNALIAFCCCVVLIVAIQLMPALGPHSRHLNLLRISIFAFIMGITVANVLNLLFASSLFLFFLYIVVPPLFSVMAFYVSRNRAKMFSENAIKLSQALCSTTIINVREPENFPAGLNSKQKHDVIGMMLTARKDLIGTIRKEIGDGNDIGLQTTTIQFLSDHIQGSPYIYRFVFRECMLSINTIIFESLFSLKAYASQYQRSKLIKAEPTGLGRRLNLLSETCQLLLKLSQYSSYYLRTLSRDKMLIAMLIDCVNYISHGRVPKDDEEGTDNYALDFYQHWGRLLSVLQLTDNKNQIRSKSHVVTGIMFYPPQKTKTFLEVSITNNLSDKVAGCTALFLEGDVVHFKEKVSVSRRKVWSAVCNIFNVIWLEPREITKKDLISMLGNTIQGSTHHEVVLLMLPTAVGVKRVIERVEGMLEHAETDPLLQDALRRVLVKVIPSAILETLMNNQLELQSHSLLHCPPDLLRAAGSTLHDIISNTLQTLNLEIDNHTLVGKMTVSVKHRQTKMLSSNMEKY